MKKTRNTVLLDQFYRATLCTALSAVVLAACSVVALAADVRVEKDHSVSSNDTVRGRLFIEQGGYYDWYFGDTAAGSTPLGVYDFGTPADVDYLPGNVTLYEGAIFRPIATLPEADYDSAIKNRVVMRYDGWLAGTFTEIDDSQSPFYEFELDYSVAGQVRVNATLLTKPKPLSDIVTTGLSIANRKMYRQAFAQLTRETYYGASTGQGSDGYVAGQSDDAARTFWALPIFRATKFASSFHDRAYDFESYGFQLGSTFWSDRMQSLGLVFGYERGLLRNHRDSIRSHDYYLGLYYGRMLPGCVEFRGFVGGGHQRFTMFRNDALYHYSTRYEGSSFELNLELARLLALQNDWLLRPFTALDVEYGDQESAQENEVGDAFRYYQRASLSQMFLRVGADLEKRWRQVDWSGSFGYTFMALGRTRAKASLFYPTRGYGTRCYGTRLGRSSLNFRTGLNWSLNASGTSTIFIDYLADVYLDRADDPALHTASFGMTVRF